MRLQKVLRSLLRAGTLSLLGVVSCGAPGSLNSRSGLEDRVNDVQETFLQNTAEDADVQEAVVQEVAVPEVVQPSKEEKIEKFVEWAKERNIELVGLRRSTDFYWANGFVEEDVIDARKIPGLLKVADVFYKIAIHGEDLFDVMYNKTIYVCKGGGNGYAISQDAPTQILFNGFNRGIVLGYLSEYLAGHEFMHILDQHGVLGENGDPENHWRYMADDRNDIFKVGDFDSGSVGPPEGFLTWYSTGPGKPEIMKDEENVADHGIGYVLNGAEFRKRAKKELENGNPLLQRKYDYFRYGFFHGMEY